MDRQVVFANVCFRPITASREMAPQWNAILRLGK